MEYICAGLLAHVDAGKTTLSEALLYEGGALRKLGRVDHGDAFFDTYALERSRGITIFSKQAVMRLGEKQVTLLDTPGHADFSAEMERTLQVLDYAVLVISGTDGIDVYKRQPQNREILPKIRQVLDKCREKGVLIIFMQHCNRQGKYDRKAASMRPNCLEGTFGIEIDPLLPVDREKDYVIRKRRYSGFFGTDLDLVLRENEIRNVIIVGTKTNCCIRATVTDAFYLDYELSLIHI